MSDPELHSFSAPGSPSECSLPPLVNSARSPSSAKPSLGKAKGKAVATCAVDVPTSRSAGSANSAHASSAFGLWSQRIAENVAPIAELSSDDACASRPVDKSFNLTGVTPSAVVGLRSDLQTLLMFFRPDFARLILSIRGGREPQRCISKLRPQVSCLGITPFTTLTCFINQ